MVTWVSACGGNERASGRKGLPCPVLTGLRGILGEGKNSSIRRGRDSEVWRQQIAPREKAQTYFVRCPTNKESAFCSDFGTRARRNKKASGGLFSSAFGRGL